MRNPLYWARRSALELYQGLVQSNHNNNVAIVLPVPLLGVGKGLEHRMLLADQYKHQRVHPLSLTPRSLQFSAIHLFLSSPHTFQTSVAPLAVYPPPNPDIDFNYEMVEHTLPASLFAIGPSGSGGRGDDEDEDDDDASVRRNPQKIVVHHVVGPKDIGDIS
ncbi:hypothetical protein V6N13_048707 [Hibiscus sabdariffa]